MTTDWLPDLVLFEHSGGDWNRYVQRLHQYFEADFVTSKPSWPGKRVGFKRHPEYQGKSATFWHLISEGTVESDRTPDLRRCECIRWPRPMMEEFDDCAPGTSSCRLTWWKSTRKGEVRFVLALNDFSYVLVVADRGDFVIPWTAYCVERQHQRDRLSKECAAFWRARKG